MEKANTAKRKRTSKKSKRSWRKDTDIQDVEEFLEEERLQERTGGRVADKEDADLFFVDKEVKKKAAPVSKRGKRVPKPLKCHAALLPDPRVKAAFIPPPKATTEKIDPFAENRSKVAANRRKRSVQNAEVAQKKFSQRSLPATGKYDLWNHEVPSSHPEEEVLIKQGLGKVKVNVPDHRFKKPSGVAAVEVAPAGASYNPTFEDHQNLLQEVEEKRQIQRRIQDKLKKRLDDKFPSKKDAPTQATWLEEMGTGLSENVSDDEDADNVMDTGTTPSNPPVRAESRKTKQQRRKEKELKQALKLKVQEKKVKKYQNDVFRLKSIKKEIHVEEKTTQNRITRKAQLKEKFKDRPKKLGSIRFREPDKEVKLGDELEGSLRLLRPKGCLLKERFHSLQKRNIIEAKKRAKKPKSRMKPKYYERRSYRDAP